MKYQPPFKYGASPASAGIHSDIADAPYVNGDPVTGDEGSIPPAEAFEHPMREILAVIEAADIAPLHTDLTQLLQAIRFFARFEAKLESLGSGFDVYAGRETEGDFAHLIRTVRAGSNVTIIEDTDGALKISAAGGGGPGSTDTGSGLGVEINEDAEADLAYQRLPAGPPTRADADTMAWRTAVGGAHQTMTWAQLRAALTSIVTNVTNNIGGTDVIKDEWNDTTGGFQTLGASTPTYALPDIDLKRVGGILSITVNTLAVAVPNGQILIELSFDGGTTWLSIGTQAAMQPRLYDLITASVPFAANYSGAMYFEFRASSTGARQLHYQSPMGPVVPGTNVAAPASQTVKARARYTGTGSPLRVHGYRIVSDLGKPTTVTPTVDGSGNDRDTGV